MHVIATYTGPPHSDFEHGASYFLQVGPGPLTLSKSTLGSPPHTYETLEQLLGDWGRIERHIYEHTTWKDTPPASITIAGHTYQLADT